MPQRKSRFMVGLFVTVGIMLAVVIVVWLGASKYFEEGDLYITYFDESVQGLQADSRVKYRGVDVGKVQRISVASDEKLVEVVVKIDLAGAVEQNIVAQLRAAGITGIVFIELDQRNPQDAILMPPSGMKSVYPVIPSQTSQTKQMLSSVDRIMEKIEQVDLKGISDQVKKTSRAIETFLTDRQMKSIMTNLDSTSANFDRSLRRIDGLLAEGKMEGLLEQARQGLGETRQGIAETRQGIAEMRRLMNDVRDEVASLKAAEIAGRANALLEGLERRTRGMSVDLEETTEDVRQTAESLRLLLDRLRENPSDLIFSRPRNDDPKREDR
jgi:phospholipid/cholesterol/gamma-HCH transport system substrate-binding protein